MKKLNKQAIESAQRGFATWSAMSAIEREAAYYLKPLGLLRERNDELAKIEVLDTGKPWQEASVVDVLNPVQILLNSFAGLAPGIEGNQQAS